MGFNSGFKGLIETIGCVTYRYAGLDTLVWIRCDGYLPPAAPHADLAEPFKETSQILNWTFCV